jgi:hypothetical protein
MRRLCLFLALVSSLSAAASAPVPLKPSRVTTSASASGSVAERIIDGDNRDSSRWISVQTRDPIWIELELPRIETLAGLHVYSGFEGTRALRSFGVQFWRDNAWHPVPSAQVTGNAAPALALKFDDTVVVSTQRLRLWITETPDGTARVAEIVVWPASASGVPPVSPAGAAPAPPPPSLIFLNQSGFNLGQPKRFTAPTVPAGSAFTVEPARGGPAVFTGTLVGQVGDFTAFNPTDDREYVVVAGPHRSVPFRVGRWWLERVTTQNAIHFMVDSRHYVGNERAVCRGSYGWRDDHHFGWELTTLVPQFLSNPSVYAAQPRQVTYEPPTDPKLWGALEPYRADAPDLVKLIHWGADIIVTQKLSHELLKAQLPYFLYAWPWLKAYLPEQNYTVVRDYTFAVWNQPKADRTYPYDESPEHDLLALKTKVGTTKGAYPPGFSIEPNLLLHAVAVRDGRADAEVYFQAAYRQAEWLIAHLDWNDPLTTKGQRMSEFITLTGLAHLLRIYPDRAPAGLAGQDQRLGGRGRAAFGQPVGFPQTGRRCRTRGPRWETSQPCGMSPAMSSACPPPCSPPGPSSRIRPCAPGSTNSSGRTSTPPSAGIPPAVTTPSTPRAKIEGVEAGWYSFHVGGIGRLEKARFVLDGAPKTPTSPIRPELGNIGWTEGWVQFNTPFNLSLAYLAHASTRIEAVRDATGLALTLTAPVNLDPSRVETATVTVTSASGDAETVTVSETSPDRPSLVGRIRFDASAPVRANDGILQAPASSRIEVSYGHGYLARRTAL